MLKEGKEYILQNEVSLTSVDLVAGRVLSRIEEYWDNLLRSKEDNTLDPVPDNSLAEDIRDKPLKLVSGPKSSGHGKRSRTPPNSNTSSEGVLVIDESRPKSDDDIFA